MFIIKLNREYYEVIEYYPKKEGIKKNPDRTRNYAYESAQRAKNKVLEFALNNEFNFFITLTFNIKKIDRYDYSLLKKEVLKYFHKLKRKHSDFIFILIPELHKLSDKGKALHFHGLVYLSKDLKKDLKLHFNSKQLDEYDNEVLKYHSKSILEKWGRNEFVAIYNSQRFIAIYITKYVTKAIGKNKILTRHYYSSRNLKESKILYKGQQPISPEMILGLVPTYEGQFTKKWTLEKEDFKLYREEIQLNEKDFNTNDALFDYLGIPESECISL